MREEVEGSREGRKSVGLGKVSLEVTVGVKGTEE